MKRGVIRSESKQTDNWMSLLVMRSAPNGVLQISFFFYILLRSSAILIISFLKVFFSFTLVSFFFLFVNIELYFILFLFRIIYSLYFPVSLSIWFFLSLFIFYFLFPFYTFSSIFRSRFIFIFYSIFFYFSNFIFVFPCFLNHLKMSSFNYFFHLAIYLSFLYYAFSFLFSSTQPFFDYFISFITSSTSCLNPFLPFPSFFFHLRSSSFIDCSFLIFSVSPFYFSFIIN